MFHTALGGKGEWCVPLNHICSKFQSSDLKMFRNSSPRRDLLQRNEEERKLPETPKHFDTWKTTTELGEQSSLMFSRRALLQKTSNINVSLKSKKSNKNHFVCPLEGT